jgi:hypothetical protein
VDTVYLGCWRRETIEALGGWDEANLQWGAEDHELNLRLHEAGGVIVLDPTIRSWYFPRDTPRGLWRQYRNYGLGKASTLAKHRSLPTWRPLAPAGLVAATVLLSARRRRAGLALVGVHLGLSAALARRLARQPGVDLARTVAAVEICHWAYGIGFWQGVGRILRRRPFDSRPRGHR